MGVSLFLVGASRSGTELLRAALNRNPRINIAHETHYFDDLRPRIGGGTAVLSSAGRRQALDYFTALRANSYGLTKIVGSRPAQALKLQGDTGDALFAEYCGANAGSAPGTFWGDKTPRHLFRAEDIVSAFPEAKIILILRDPRSVVASYRDWRNAWIGQEGEGATIEAASLAENRRIRASYSVTTIALMWRSAAREAMRLSRRLGPEKFGIIKFETLVTEPAATLIDLCAWIGVPFDPDMLGVPLVNSSYAQLAQGAGFDPTIADRWRKKLSRDEIAAIDLLTAAPARELGYAGSDLKASTIYLAQELGGAPFRVLRAVFANRRRIGALLPYLAARLRGLA